MIADAKAAEGWGRLWAFGSPHYVRGRTTLCGLNANPEELKLTLEPDGEPCKHCARKVQAERKGTVR